MREMIQVYVYKRKSEFSLSSSSVGRENFFSLKRGVFLKIISTISTCVDSDDITIC